ncbi:YcaO-like family protein [Clostridium gasigenes]|uniref:YcaO-like family protein n=1 Tax=Clostridium gasigenes TaxID=94869 RepID=UPI001C0E4C2C|nr:YcaO-like family protein [Clostridium gasigenes]MBU3134520.1 YcaO-like family protein [Clostridium gasigenes]
MSLQQKMHFKETNPIETVNRLKSILDKYNIETEENWIDESSVGTYSIRLTFKGTEIGANGKGVSREYASASAYAELFERYQNNLLASASVWQLNSSCKINNDEKYMTSKEIAELDNEFTKFYFSERGLLEASIDEKAKAFYNIQKTDFIATGKDDLYNVTPFYSVKTKKVEYLPKNTYKMYYGSNGMCAGNSPEEALVQGLAEIIERVVQAKMFLEKPSFPDIPEEYIKKFPYIYEMLKKLRTNKGYVYIMKDCSMGGKYPVAALIILEKNTGNYGIKVGCHPDFGVAMERAFTEAAQGQDILAYASRSKVDFDNINVLDRFNIYNSFKIGMGQYPYQIFDKNPTYPFVEMKDVSQKNNRELLSEWVKELLNDGYDILIKDVSHLGFPSYHIIIPGLSEMINLDDSRFRTYNTRVFVSSLLSDPRKINKSNTKYIIGTMDFFQGSLMEQTMKSYYPMYELLEFPGDEIGCGCLYLSTMCHILDGDYDGASKKMKIINGFASRYKLDKNKKSIYNGMDYYLSGMAVIKNHEKTMEYMELLFDEDICKEINNLFKETGQVIVKQYPITSNYSECNIIEEYMQKLKTIQLERPISQLDNRLIFEL